MKFPVRASATAFLLAVTHGKVDADVDGESSIGTDEGETSQTKRSFSTKFTESSRQVITREAGHGLSKQPRVAKITNNEFLLEEEEYWDRFLQTTSSWPPEVCNVEVSLTTVCLKLGMQ